MLGERTEQRGLWEADRMYLDYVGKDTFYGLLASLRGQLFRDADFAEFYCLDNGRTSVPPSLLATALLLQTYDKVSDAEAKARGDFDIRWKVALGKVALGKVALGKVALGKVALGKVALGKVALGKVALGKVALGKVALGKVALGKVALGKVALGIEVEDRPFAKSTLQVFRGQLILHDQVREVFERSLRLARETGYLKRRSLRVALDTTYILGRGAVKDTYNLLADGMVKLLRALAAVDRTTVKAWAEAQGYQRYLGSSVKGRGGHRLVKQAGAAEAVGGRGPAAGVSAAGAGHAGYTQRPTAGDSGGCGVVGTVAATGCGLGFAHFKPRRRVNLQVGGNRWC